VSASYCVRVPPVCEWVGREGGEREGAGKRTWIHVD